MAKRKRAAVLPTNIALLQNLIRRDPSSYVDEFRLQHQHYASLRDIFFSNPRAPQNSDGFGELITFLSHMCTCFPKETAEFPTEISRLLQDHHDALDPGLADKILCALVSLRNKGILPTEELIKIVFPLLVSTESKQLRTACYSCIIQTTKLVNEPAKNIKVNKVLQAQLFNLLSNAESNGLWATKITRELWRRGVWDDSRSVEIMCQAALHQDTKVASSAIRFFLGADQERRDALEHADSDDESLDMAALRHKFSINKKSSKRSKLLEQAAKQVQKKQRNSSRETVHLNFSAIQLLRDPQGFAEKLYSTHLSNKASNSLSRFTLDQKIACTNLVSRMIGVHKLTILGMYSYFLKYLTPKQRDVTQFMAAAAQAAHDLVPPDAIAPVVRKIANEFVSDGVAAEVAAAGLNTIREIIVRAPLAIDEPLLHDLIEYRKSKSKSVMMAAKSIISAFREIDPSLLPSKERGKAASIALRTDPTIKKPQYGQASSGGIEGLELLQKWKAENEDQDADPKDGWQVDSEAEEEEDDDDGEWITVESDREYEVSDSDDDTEKKEPKEDAPVTENSQDLATGEILTPADFAKLDQLKLEAGIRKAFGQANEDIVEVSKLSGSNKYKQNKEERLQQVHEGREGREFGSRKNKHMEKEHSTTNKQKARKKNFVMMIHKKDVQGKARKSLRDKQRILRAHVERQKKRLQ